MADENTAVESSPTATLEVPTGEKDYTTWRQTGELPAAKEVKPKEDPAPSKESAAAEKPAEKTAPAPEAGESHQEHKPRSNAESRLTELLADLKKAGFTPAELKSFKREAQKEDQPKPEPTVKPAGTEAPKRPKIEDFLAAGKSYEDFEAARDQYADDIAEYKATQAVAKYRAEQQQEAAQRATAAKLSDAKERYGAEAEAVIRSTATTIGNSPEVPAAVKAIVDGSSVLTDLLFVLGSKDADLSEFMELSRTDPGAAIRKVVLLESMVKAELAGAKPADSETPRDASGKFVKEKTPPEKKTTEAPPPPKELGGKGSVPGDEMERAASQNDFRTFREAANRRDLAQRKGQ